MTPQIAPVGDSAVMISLPLPVTPDYPRYFHAVQQRLRAAFPDCRDTVAGYRNLIAIFHGRAPDSAALCEALADLAPTPETHEENILDIPVCYHPELAPDLLPLAQAKNLAPEQLIALHSAPLYTVHCIGFIPGFPFLAEVDARIAAPRHSEPRREVAAGSVGIAGRQTGIYPIASPGGWQLIGRTPLPLYQPEKNLYSRFAVGMRVRFVPISLEEYHARLP